MSRLILVVAGVLAMSSLALAQQQNIIIEPGLRQPVVSVGRPMLTWWDVKIGGPGLVVGQLQFVIRHEQEVLGKFLTDELSLNGPEQRIRVLLPAVDSFNTVDQLTVDISFQGKKFSAKLGEQILRCPMVTKKSMLALVAETKTVSGKPGPNVTPTERLKIELIATKADRLHALDPEKDFIKTIFGTIDAVDFPAEPLSYCGFDLVALPGQELRNLKRPQLDALLAWVKGGGSLFVETHGVLEKYHVEFLKSLAGTNPQKLEFDLDPSGKLPPESIPGERELATLNCGLGVAVIRVSEADLPKVDFNSEWQSAIGALWKVRKAPVKMPEGVYGFVVGKDGRPVEAMAENPDPYGLSMWLRNRFELLQSDLLDRIMPKGVRMVPTWVLAMILGSFILMIGPGDYYVLGWLRARKLTWLTFPVVTIAATAFTFWMSNLFMSASEAVRSVEIHDVDDVNDIVRTNRFDLLYVSNSRRMETKIERGLFTALNPLPADTPFNVPVPAGAVGPMVYNLSGMINQPGVGVAAPAYTPWQETLQPKLKSEVVGRIPTQFTVSQDLPKWTPQLNRVLEIPVIPTNSEIDWSQFQLSAEEVTQIRVQMLPRKLAERIKTQFGPEAIFACYSGANGCAFVGSPEWSSTRTNQEQQYYRQRLNRRFAFQGNESQDVNLPGFIRWLKDASVVAPYPGPFSLFKQTAPKGSASCEDLPTLDATDPTTWMLVVVIPNKDSYTIYRKHMRVTD